MMALKMKGRLGLSEKISETLTIIKPVRIQHGRKELSALARKLEVFPGEVTNPDLGVRKEHLAGLTEIGSVPR